MWFILIHIVCKWISIDRLYITMIDRQLRSIGSDILYYDNIYVLNLRKQNCMNNLAVKNKKFVCLFYCFHFFTMVEWNDIYFSCFPIIHSFIHSLKNFLFSTNDTDLISGVIIATTGKKMKEWWLKIDWARFIIITFLFKMKKISLFQ